MVDQGGSLTVNPRPGGGASFMLTLPSSPSPSPEHLPQVAEQPESFSRSRAAEISAGGRSMSRRVLVVEDQVLMAIALQLALSARCWDVETISGPTPDRCDRACATLPAAVRAPRHPPRRSQAAGSSSSNH